MAKFKFKGAEYEMVDANDLDFEEIDDLERHTSFNLAEGRVSTGGLIWISIRRRYPQTTWEDLKKEKMIRDFEMLPDEDEQSLPPTSSDANGSSTVDDPKALVGQTDSGSPG